MHEINWLAVVAAAVATMALGALWYSPLLFGKLWVRAHGFTKEQLDRMKESGMGKAYGLSFVAYLVMATVLSLLIEVSRLTTAFGGACIGWLCWLGFAATIGLTSYLFSERRFSTYLIDAGYQLVYLVMMGAILGAWR